MLVGKIEALLVDAVGGFERFFERREIRTVCSCLQMPRLHLLYLHTYTCVL